MQKVIAIDGPSGSGKSTMAKNLAKELNILYIDTGAMYRALAYFASLKDIPFQEGESLSRYLNELTIEYGNEDALIRLDGEDLSQKIREHQVSALASQFSQLPSVRKFLIGFQRDLGQKKVCVMEGRDISTVVFPEAFCKIFVTASAEVRAKRRLSQLVETGKDEGISFEQVLKDVEERDRLDIEREVSPLKVAEDAVVVDTSDMSPADVLNRLIEISQEKAKAHNLSL